MTRSRDAGPEPAVPTRPRWAQRLHVRFLAIVTASFLLIILPAAWLLFGTMQQTDNLLLASRIGSLSARAAGAIDRHGAHQDPALARDLLAPLAADRAFLCAELRQGPSVVAAVPTAQGCVTGLPGESLEIPVGDRPVLTLRARFTDAELVETRRLELALTISAVTLAFLAVLAAGSLSYRLLIWRPLSRLNKAIALSAGTGPRRTVDWNSRDEIGLIVQAYNRLAIKETDRERELRSAYDRARASEQALGALNRDLEERVRQRTEQLEIALHEADRANDSKTQFLWSMSHELRTPLNAIIGFSEVISSQVFGPVRPVRYRAYADDILYSGRHLLKVINDLLDIARIEVGRERLDEAPTETGPLVANTLRVIAPLAEESHVALDSAVADGPACLMIDATKMQQILLNLLANAVKHTPSGGTVSLDVGIADDGRPRFRVSDTGHGIPAEALTQVLEPFGRAEGGASPHFQKGTGLGLPLARKMAELHGGELVLKSTVDVGTDVTVYLPASRILPADAAQQNARSAVG
ncbi:MAG: ATP-binding protein [Thalassobaculaceae bacterium]